MTERVQHITCTMIVISVDDRKRYFSHSDCRISIHIRLFLLADVPVELGRRVTRSDFMPFGQCSQPTSTKAVMLSSWSVGRLVCLSVSVNRIMKTLRNVSKEVLLQQKID